MMEECSAPQLKIEDIILNDNNPFKKRISWNRIRCRICDEIVLGKAIGNQKEWDKIRSHLRVVHGINEDEGIPIRLLSSGLYSRWIRIQMKKIKQVKVVQKK